MSATATVRALADERRATAGTRYRELVATSAVGEEVSPDEVLDLLEGLGRDADDFDRDVRQLEHRAEMRRKVAALPAAVEQWEDVRAKIDAADAEYAALVEAWNAKRSALVATRNRLTAAIEEGETARRELFLKCPDPALHEKHARITGKLEAIRPAVEEARKVIAHLSPYTGDDPPDQNADYTAAMKQAKERTPVYKQKLADLDAERARLEAELATCEQAMRDA